MTRSTRTLFFSVGEPSGDLHAANLIRAIRALDNNVRCTGFGGPQMANAGCALLTDLTQYAVMWLAKVIANLAVFVRLLVAADRYFRDHRPDAVVLIDYPGFNWWVAWRAKAHGIPVVYYGAPQLWAWAGWRVGKMRRLTDHVLCKLPFEEAWFRQRGCHARYVGHPFFDELAQRRLDAQFCDAVRLDQVRLLTLLPGSRDQEVENNLPLLLRAAEKVKAGLAPAHPQDTATLRIAVASFNEKQAAVARTMIAAIGSTATVCVRRTPELIELADCCLACSGSVSLELMHHEKPAVILYVVNRFAHFLQNWLRTARYISLVNLLATDRVERKPFEPNDAIGGHVPYPEFVTCRDISDEFAAEALALFNDPTRSQEVVAQLRRLKQQYGQPGASVRAATFVLRMLDDQPVQPTGGLTGPHQRRPKRKNRGRRDQEAIERGE